MYPIIWMPGKYPPQRAASVWAASLSSGGFEQMESACDRNWNDYLLTKRGQKMQSWLKLVAGIVAVPHLGRTAGEH